MAEENWKLPCQGHGLSLLVAKLRKLATRLRHWNSTVFGNVINKVKLAEERLKIAESQLDQIVNSERYLIRLELTHSCTTDIG